MSRAAAEAPYPGGFLHERALLLQEAIVVAAEAGHRNAGGEHRLLQVAAARHAQPAVDQEGALALLGPEELVGQRLIDGTGDDLALLLGGDRDREVRDAVQEVQGAVERGDDPATAARVVGGDRKSTRLNSSHECAPRMQSSA